MLPAQTIAKFIMMNTQALYSDRVTFSEFRKGQSTLWAEAEAAGCADEVRDLIVRAHRPL